jgi:rhodanese-related sulfurtransferase
MNQYWPLIVLTLWFTYKWWSSRKIVLMLPELKKRGAVLIDVRSPGEYASGHAPGTLNIPLQEVQSRLNEIPTNVPVIVACASGTRSGMAKMVFKKGGFKEVYNIGTWTKFNS